MLSHVALVIPNPNKSMLKQLEVLFFKFIWNNKSEKIRREDAKLPEKLGGLNVPDIENFWISFKFSWIRKLITSQAFWPKIILHQISENENELFTFPKIAKLGLIVEQDR